MHLPGQIVGVVGPNGCGKSNVIDALRWVLGESKASALRGESMQDVIFNGSGKRKPVSRASVELVFDNSQGKAGGQWSSYAEISIGRVLHRNGESSYLINNQKVRRRDITDIFLGTGLGARAYAIIEQGMISRIIEAKPEELRVFLEEAAGVSKYRDRRRETAQRLGDTRDNLQRVDDILLEMDSQLARLEQQAAVAQQYRQLEDQRNTTQHLLWLVKKQDAEAQRAGHARDLEGTRTAVEAKTARLREIESQLEMMRSSHYQLSDALHERQGALYSANAEIATLEQQIKQAALQQQRLQQQIAGIKQQIEQQQQQHRQAVNQLEEWQLKQEEAVFRLEEAQLQVQAADEYLPEAEDAAKIAQDNYNGLQREQSQLQSQLQLADTQHAHLQRNIVQLQARRQRLEHELDQLAPPDLAALHDAQEELATLEMESSAMQESLADLQEQLPQADALLRNQRGLVQQQERVIVQHEARQHALQKLQSALDNDKKLHDWLHRHQLEKLPRLWQSIRIANGWESALEAVLRERLNALSMPGLADFDDVPPARVALFEAALDAVRTEAVDAAADVFHLTALQSHVECLDEQVLPAIGEWLAQVYTVENVRAGLALREQLSTGAVFVTPEGHLIGRHSVVYHAPDGHLHGVLSRQREIDTLETELDQHKQSLVQLRLNMEQAERDHKAIETKIPPLRSRVNEQQQRRHALQMQILKLDQQRERTEERRLQVGREIAEVMESLSIEQAAQNDKSEQMAMQREALALCKLQVEEAQHRAHALDIALREQREAARRSQHALQEAQFFSRTCQDKISDLHQAIERMVETQSYAEDNLQSLQAELSAGSDDNAASMLQAALEVRREAELALSDARISLDNAVAGLQSLEQARISSEHELGSLRERLNTLTLKEQEARLYSEQWAEQLQDVDEQALVPLLKGVKPGSLQSELNRLDRAIEALGSVNLAALDELKTATERKFYLQAQAEDLQQAIATLEDAIRHIDGESRQLLMDTYNQVNLHLAELFPVLFAGGEARLVLTGEEILDSGLQVMAQPPGKKNSTIHLLSGGEKALTAIALIFSLFRLNPAPFCLLDEVDAPLDDTNTERLCALIRKMALHTQFVFISHNKIAMEMAQQLIGVTMQEKGVSKVVSVDIEAALRMRDEVVV